MTTVDNFGVDGRRAVASRAARPPGDAVHPRRLVGQEAGASDRAEPGLSARLEGHAEASASPIRPIALVWRHSPRRLDAEEIRDAMLAAAGSLDRPARPAHRPAS